MVFDQFTTGYYEGGTVTYLSTIRGYDIYWISAPLALYGLVDPDGVELGNYLQDYWDIEGWIYNRLGPEFPHLDAPPAEEGREWWHYTIHNYIQIWKYMPGSTQYAAYIFDKWYYSTDATRVMAEVTAYAYSVLPEPLPYEPTAKEKYVEYRGVMVYQYTWNKWFIVEVLDAFYTYKTYEEARAKIDEILGSTGLPDEYITTWGGYAIWKSGLTSMYYVMVDDVAEGNFSFLTDAQEYIENVLNADPGGSPVGPGEAPDYTDMSKDPARAALISGPVKTFLRSVGLTEEALEAVKGSGADPEKAAAYAQSVALASVGAIAILGTIGVVAEVASLGQVETVAQTMDMVLEKTGIAGLLDEMFRLPFMSALVTPARHYWNSVYTPEIPGSGDLITFLVREIITPAEFNKTMALQGYSQKWADDYWEAHWRLPSIGDIIRAEHRGLVTRPERDAYFILHDYRSDPRPFTAPYDYVDPVTGELVPAGREGYMSKSDLDIYGGLTKTLLGRVDTRRAYQYGYMERPALIDMYKALGYEEDAELQADIQIRASVDGLQSAIRREQGMMYRDRLKDAREDESAAVGKILTERDIELTVIMLRWMASEMEEIDLILIPAAYRERATALGPVSEEEALVLEADLRAKADSAIAEVRALVGPREEEAETMYRTALEEVKELIDPEDLWVMRYKLSAERAEIAEEFEIEPPTIVEETPEEPE